MEVFRQIGCRYRIWASGVKAYCRLVINTPPPFKGLSSRIPIIIPIEGRVFISGVYIIIPTLNPKPLGFRVYITQRSTIGLRGFQALGATSLNDVTLDLTP